MDVSKKEHVLSESKMYPAAAENGKTTLNHIRKATSDKTNEISLSQSADLA